jgi:NADH:ubiquinone oxidoreductase subunit E
MELDLPTLIKKHIQTPGALLPLLHDIQHSLGYIPEAWMGEIAYALNLSKAEVFGVVSFYHHFRSTPSATNSLQVCRAEACQAMGGEALYKTVCEKTNCAPQSVNSKDISVSPDGRFDVQAVYCLGLCATAPSMLVNNKPFARMNAARFNAVLERLP